MSDATAVAAPPPPTPGVLARAVGILTSPTATYEKVIRKPRTVGILALVALVMGGSSAAFLSTSRGQQAMVDMQVQQYEKFMHQPVSDEQYATYQKMAPYSPYLSFVQMFVGLPVGLLMITAVLWAVFNAALGGTASFKEVMAVAAHSMVISAFGMLVFGMPLNFLRGSMSSAPANLGLLLPMLPEGSILANFLGFLDVFQIWATIVLAIGLGVLYKRKARNIAITLLSVYGAIVLIVAFFISR